MKSFVRVSSALAVSVSLLLAVSACKSAGNVRQVPASGTVSVAFRPLSERCKVDTDRNDLAVRRGASPRSMPSSCSGVSPSVWRAFVASDTAMLRRVYGG
jgi:hypothetical protein